MGEQRYYPYGETRLTTGSIYTDKLFTGQREMAGLGIYHYQARFYSPKLGRFLSADTIVPGAGNPQAYNRYSYVLGNPLRYTDPTGHYCVGDDADCADEGGTGPATMGTGSSNNNNNNNNNPNDPTDEEDDPNPSRVTLPTPEKVVDYPWEYSTTFTDGAHLGPTAHVFFPDYNDDNYNGWPWASGPYDDSDNFFISVLIYYNQSTGIHMSDISWSNQYNGLAGLDSVKINDQIIATGQSYIPADGVWRPIQGSGGDWDSDTSISIDFDVAWIGNAGQGIFPLYVSLSIDIPSLNQVMSLVNP